MPMFEYRCSACGTVSEFLVGVTADEPDIVCDSCGSTKLEKKISAMSFTIKGGSSAPERFPIAGQCACGGEQSGGTCGGGSCGCSA